MPGWKSPGSSVMQRGRTSGQRGWKAHPEGRFARLGGWPAIEYSKLANVPTLLKYAGSGIPDLVIVDASGKVLADTYVRGNYVGPTKVLDALTAIFARGNSPQVATNR